MRFEGRLAEADAAPALPRIDLNAYEELGWEHWHSIAELRLIGLLLLHPEWNRSCLSPDYFHAPLHRRIFLSLRNDEGKSAALPDIPSYAIELATVFHVDRDIVPSTFERDMAVARRVSGIR